jgi:hypothetical protein
MQDFSNTRYRLIYLLLLCFVCPAFSQTSKLKFSKGPNGGYRFDTGIVKGVLRKDGKSRGLSSVVHVPTGARLDGGSGIMGYYRVFTTNQRYGSAGWNWPSTARLLPDGAVEITWPAQEGRSFSMVSVYRWQDKKTLDLETTVKADRDVNNFEVFLSSYFHKALTTPTVCVQLEPEGPPALMVAEQVKGDWQMFLRDPGGLSLVRDGRWLQPPNPVDWVIRPPLALPLCVRRGPEVDVTAMLMAPKQDCYAISTPYKGETHYSLYLSLFGHDIKAGHTATARARFVVTGEIDDQEILGVYEAYKKDLVR